MSYSSVNEIYLGAASPVYNLIVHFSAHILERELACKFGMMEWDFIYLLSFLALVRGFMHETSDVFTLQ